MIAPVIIMAPTSTLSIRMMGIVYFMIVVILFDGAQLQGATAIRFRVPGSVDVPSSSQLSNSEKAVDDDEPVVESTTVRDAVVEPANVEPIDFIAMFTDSQQDEGVAAAGSYNHFKSWKFGVASSPPPANNVEMIRKISEPEDDCSATVHHQRTSKFHAQRANKGSAVPAPPGGNPGHN
ncbi:unnamed protein product [Sphagnum jensenii]|jgi:hypothetical protein|uniref:Uncharacterized protein n=2 Tax=Sphagnum jensenii TaxID=128206 RepID=A0ABP0ZZ95_9BRYO